MKVRKASTDIANMSNFLRLNEMYKDRVLVTKLTKIIEEFLRNHYLKSFGFQKYKYDPR